MSCSLYISATAASSASSFLPKGHSSTPSRSPSPTLAQSIMDLAAMSANDDVSSWVCFDDYPSPTTPADELLSPSFFASSAATTGAAMLDASTSILCKDDDTLGDLSFDWPHKVDSLSTDPDFSCAGMFDSTAFQMYDSIL